MKLEIEGFAVNEVLTGAMQVELRKLVDLARHLHGVILVVRHLNGMPIVEDAQRKLPVREFDGR